MNPPCDCPVPKPSRLVAKNKVHGEPRNLYYSCVDGACQTFLFWYTDENGTRATFTDEQVDDLRRSGYI